MNRSQGLVRGTSIGITTPSQCASQNIEFFITYLILSPDHWVAIFIEDLNYLSNVNCNVFVAYRNECLVKGVILMCEWLHAFSIGIFSFRGICIIFITLPQGIFFTWPQCRKSITVTKHPWKKFKRVPNLGTICFIVTCMWLVKFENCYLYFRSWVSSWQLHSTKTTIYLKFQWNTVFWMI